MSRALGQITRREHFPTSVDVPLTDECKKVLNLAGEEADRLGHRHVGTEHVLLAPVTGGRLGRRQGAAGEGLKLEEIRQHLIIAPGPASFKATPEPGEGAIVVLQSFLTGLSR